jgi:hypothetical protein
MNKFSLIVFSVLILISCNSSKKINLSKEPSNPNFEKIYPFALRGELTNVFEILDTISDIKLNNKEKLIKRNFYNRFRFESEIYNFKTDDTKIIGFVKNFQVYWKAVMLNEQLIEIADSLFKKSMAAYLLPHFQDKNISHKGLKSDLYKYSNQYLKDLGYFSNAYGKTGHLYDLFLWKEEDVKVYPIELINDSVKVPVHFMKNFISTGWSHYTTFGRNYASGWATKKALYSVENAYDRNTEKFKVSYLVHEGQHFVDYQNFPLLKQADLEYRAKLVELAKSQETTYTIIGKFIFNAKKDKNNAHALANYCVIRDLSRLLFSEDYITEKDKWTSISNEAIRNKSQLLFQTHTSKLNDLGSETVSKLISL